MYDHIRLSSAGKSKQGWLWGKQPFTSQAWIVDVSFKVHGPDPYFHGDGFAFWVTEERETVGPVFGSKDQWKGLGVFFDTFSNGKHNVSII
jgi:mannose-binding lectin 2